MSLNQNQGGATQSAYELDWETGEDKMLIVSVGTGAAPTEGEYRNLLDTATGIPTNLMYAMQVNVRKMDSVKYINQLQRVGRASANQVSLAHFGIFN